MISVSVIIPTLNRPDDLRAALESLLKQSRFPDEILVIDQSAGEESKKVMQDIQSRDAAKAGYFRHVVQQEKSLVKARNRGLSLATGDIISFLDDDVVLFEDYYEKILPGFEKDPGVVALSGNTLIRQPLTGWKWTLRRWLKHFFLISHFDGKLTSSGFGYPIFEREITRQVRVEMLPGCNMNYRRSAIGDEKFDEWFSGYGYREDADFSYRITRKGPAYMVPDAKLWHNYSLVSRLTEEQLKPMTIRNYYHVFYKFKGHRFFSTLLFYYSLLGLTVLDVIEYLSQRTPEKWGKLKAGVSASFAVFRSAG